MTKNRALKIVLWLSLGAGLLALLGFVVVMNELGDPDSVVPFGGEVVIDLPGDPAVQYSAKQISDDGEVGLQMGFTGVVFLPLDTDTETGCFEGRLEIVKIGTDSVVYSRESEDLCFEFEDIFVKESILVSEEEFLRGHP